MGVASWAVPVGVLSAIIVIAFAFFWWWFPRAWGHGVDHNNAQVVELSDDVRREQRVANRAIIDRFTKARAIERGEIEPDTIEHAPPVHRQEDLVDPPPAYQSRTTDAVP